ncbi:MAG: polyphosphate polymerase domain-containing protein [Lachnospiraceae bacterium]|nr:polyphosphate polymerase domain-containing protein [Lachnospiraceae bacterium]
MAPIQGVFKRYEKKYLLTPEKYQAVKTAIEAHMTQDIYGLHTICNIYYDTDTYELIRASIERPVYKEKFRVRSYGIPMTDSQVFLEIKKKFKGVVYKRRIAAPLSDAKAYLAKTDVSALPRSQILNEIDYMLDRVKPEPKVYIAYDRIAYYGNEDPNLRVTFDTNMRYRDYDLELDKGDYGKPILDEPFYLMEIKIPQVMPLWMTGILTQYQIYPTSFSKYGTCYKKDMLHKLDEKLRQRVEAYNPKETINNEDMGDINYA